MSAAAGRPCVLPAVPSRVPRGIGWLAPVLAAVLAVAILRAAPGAPLPSALAALAIGAATAWIVARDLATLTIPDAAVAAVAVVAAALRWSDGAAPAAMALDVLLCGGALLLFREGFYRLRGIDGLGLGDVKLAAAGALLVGTVGFAWALFAASLAGLAAVAASRWVAYMTGRAAAGPDRIAFGAVLAPAIFLVFLLEQALARLGQG